ncbi:AAA family ATPase [Vibrio crassostreae]|nr:AAA family ATPase [Vibrio crassostreae]CAK3444464.1 AAA family ATPase [Vibrio crassostreae]CAK3489695.1 AAA family ATPase [Vibrio crassostreae]CAK3504010.1 AAA family ATPase [Vibrio crassostreae]CAK3525505.1 AAA family ATPase [Vibrio crassostreae]
MDIIGRTAPTILKPQISAPAVPTSIDMLGVPEVVIENLVLKHLSAYPKSDVLDLSNYLCVVTHIVESTLAVLRTKSLIEVFQPTSNLSLSSASHSHVRYSLSEKGLEEADLAFKRDAYLGPAPVSLTQYSDVVKQQDLRAELVTRPHVETALNDVYGVDKMISVLGPAINSGRALLLYGHAGTGKTFVASRIVNALHTSVFIPYAVYALGNIIKVFSAQHHKPLDRNGSTKAISLKDQYDKRWLNCERPNIQVGGELTMDMLEVNHSENSRVWLAPVQMMANNGIFIIDDLGRQPMPVDALLNRWIVPMEYSFDYLSLPNGQQITMPFVLTLAFSTNLNPKKISDPAFLRRLGYKIEFKPLNQRDYEALWMSVVADREVELQDGFFERLSQMHTLLKVPLFPCLPKDLVGISKDILSFEQLPPVITFDILSMAWEVYFTSDGHEEENNE